MWNAHKLWVKTLDISDNVALSNRYKQVFEYLDYWEYMLGAKKV